MNTDQKKIKKPETLQAKTERLLLEAKYAVSMKQKISINDALHKYRYFTDAK